MERLEPQEPQDPLRHLVAPLSGMLAGALEISVLWPVEWAKVQRQLHRPVVDEALRLRMRIYRGLPPMLIGVPLQGAVRFSTYDATRSLAARHGVTVGPSANLAAGVVAGALEATLVVVPVETVKTRLVDSKESLLRGLVRFVRAEGLAGIYQGLVPTVAKSASNQSIRFLVFGEYRRATWGTERGAMPTRLALGGGMLAGAIGSVLTMPFDTVKTLMQQVEARREYSSTWACAASLVRTGGPRALFRGLGARLARAVPGQGIIFGSYEFSSQRMHEYLRNRRRS